MSNKTIYEVTFRLDKGWFDQFYTWLEFADVYEDEVLEVIAVKEIPDRISE